MTDIVRHSISIAAVVVYAVCMLLAACDRQPAGDSTYHEYAYVTNGKSNTVSVINALTFRNVYTIAVGQNPTGIAASPTRNEIYAVNTESDNVSVIDAEHLRRRDPRWKDFLRRFKVPVN